MKSVFGFVAALILTGTAFIAVSFEIFTQPVPVTGELLKLMLDDVAGDSHGRWMLVEEMSDSYLIYLDYPLKRNKFIVRRDEVIILSPPTKLPKRLNPGDIALLVDPARTFGK